ncbi:MAG: HepT-like ribonuclease domain-containing protein [Nitrososphaerota archaeon]
MTDLIRVSNEFVEKIREVVKGFGDVVFAAVFGSALREGRAPHDIDLAVTVSGDKYDVLCSLVEEISTRLKVPADLIDIVDLDRADIRIKKEVVTKGIVLVDRGNLLEKLVKEVSERYPYYAEIVRVNVEEWLSLPNPSEVNIEVVMSRMGFAKDEVGFLDEHVLSKGLVEVSRSPVLRRLLERGCQLIVEALTDVCRHIASAKGWGPALSYADYMRLCTEHGVISPELGNELAKAITLRNIIVHRYLEVDYAKLYEEAERLKQIVQKFEAQVRDYIKRSR